MASLVIAAIRWLAGRIEDAALDMVFGPSEDTEYESTTSPASPPPSR